MRREPRTALSILLVVAATTAPGAARAQGVVTSTQVTMPDGVKLATDVWRLPLDFLRRPVLLRRTPYGRTLTANDVNGALSQGYIVVSQDLRGRGASEGGFAAFTTEKADGKATIDWIAQQSFSDGSVGTYGASAEGITQYLAMAASPDALRCSHVAVPAHDLHDALFPGGAWREELTTAWLNLLNASDVISLWKSHEARDPYWDALTLTPTEMTTLRHPVFIAGGLFDIFATDAVRAFAALRANVPASRRDDVFLVLGPWTHSSLTASTQGDLLYPTDGAYQAYFADLLEYFGWCLKGGPRPTFANLRYYTTEVTDTLTTDPYDGQQRLSALGAWHTATAWPPPDARDQRLFAGPGGALAGRPAACTELASLAVDPDDPVPSVGGGNLTTPAGPRDQKDVDARPDVALFQTEPVTEPVEIAGSVRATVWASSATTDADVIVRVEVVTSGGRAIAMTDGVRRGRFVQGMDAVRPLTPGAPARFEVETGPLAVRLAPGQRLRLGVQSTSSPRYAPNPNVATPLATSSAPIATTVTLYCDAAHPLSVDVPVQSGRLPGAGDASADAGASADGGSAAEAGVTDAAVDAPSPAVDGGTAERDAAALPAASGGGPAAGLGGAPGASGGGRSASGGESTSPRGGAQSSCGCRTVGAPVGVGPGGLLGGLSVMAGLRRRRRALRRQEG